jgi:large subunit ribosomal protein L21
MFAIVDMLGFQERAEKGMKLRVPLMKAEVGASMTFDKVLLLADGDTVSIGAPYVAGAAVTVKVLGFGKTTKVRTAKFKRRKRYQRIRGHRQDYTDVEVTGITQ